MLSDSSCRFRGRRITCADLRVPDFTIIDLEKTKLYKDFGKGFYVTDIRQQACELAKTRSRIWGGAPVVQEYEFDETVLQSNGLRVLRFDKVCVEWAEFIYKAPLAIMVVDI